MRTDDLIELLTSNAGPAPRAVAARRLAPAALAGAVTAVLAAVIVLGLVPPAMFGSIAFWVKLGYAGLLAVAAGWLTARLSRPVSRTAAPWSLLAAVAAAMLLIGAASLLRQPADERLAYLFGHSWVECPWNVLALSLPALLAALWAVRGLAPTRPRLAGLAAGLFAGALGAAGYALACPELSMAFVATWYSLGIALTGALGAILGPRVLRW